MVTRRRVLTVTDDVVIDATPESLYALISDPSQMPRWSPENTSGRSTGSLPVGAHFDGTNKRGRRKWITRSVVTAAEPGVRFAFTVVAIGGRKPVVKAPNASWEYRFAAAEGGTRVTETWTDDRPWPDALARVFDRLATGSSFPEFQTRNIRRTLDRLKADVEKA